MKQHIAIDQLNELSPKAKEKLLAWSKTCKSLQEEILEGGYDPDSCNLSEFLDEHKLDDAFCLEKSKQWSVYFVAFNQPLVLIPPQENIELCDALWEACKQLLESKP